MVLRVVARLSSDCAQQRVSQYSMLAWAHVLSGFNLLSFTSPSMKLPVHTPFSDALLLRGTQTQTSTIVVFVVCVCGVCVCVCIHPSIQSQITNKGLRMLKIIAQHCFSKW